MKHIYLNLKRFDIPSEYGGVNSLSPVHGWGSHILETLQKGLTEFSDKGADFTAFFPEAHLIPAVKQRRPDGLLRIGCQSVMQGDTAKGGNFGAFTTGRTANAMKAIGCTDTIIGHCEERNEKLSAIRLSGGNEDVVNQLLNGQVKTAVNAGLRVLYCIGEREEQKESWQQVLREQLEAGLKGVDTACITIAYEPVWSIGPGKIPPDRDYILKIATFVKEVVPGVDVVYGGGLKADNAKMLASIPEIDGGLIALTRFAGDIGFYPEEYLEIVHLYLGD